MTRNGIAALMMAMRRPTDAVEQRGLADVEAACPNAGIMSNCLAFMGGCARKVTVNRMVHCRTRQTLSKRIPL
jgi:ribosomal protein S9